MFDETVAKFKLLPTYVKAAFISIVSLVLVMSTLILNTPKASAHELDYDHVHVDSLETLTTVMPLMPKNTPFFVGDLEKKYKTLKLPLSDYALPSGAYIEPAKEDIKDGLLPIAGGYIKDKGKAVGGYVGGKFEKWQQGFAEKWYQPAQDAQERDESLEALPEPTPQPSGEQSPEPIAYAF